MSLRNVLDISMNMVKRTDSMKTSINSQEKKLFLKIIYEIEKTNHMGNQNEATRQDIEFVTDCEEYK